MNRRVWIKEIMIVAGGLALLPACVQQDSKAAIQLKHLAISRDEEALSGAVVNAIIPATDTPGARDLQVHQFVLKMVDDCYVSRDQSTFVGGLKSFNALLKKNVGKTFQDIKVEKTPALFTDLTAATASDKDVQYFLQITRKLTILGYAQSKFVLTNINKYELVPGRFHGCVPVTAIIHS